MPKNIDIPAAGSFAKAIVASSPGGVIVRSVEITSPEGATIILSGDKFGGFFSSEADARQSISRDLANIPTIVVTK